MVVDDSNIIRRMIQRSVDNKFFEFVGSARNGLEAIEEFKLLKPKVVTMDITMPMMNGIETIDKMMEIESSVRILVISALSDKATAIEAIKKGAYGFLCKPFSELDLNDALIELTEDMN